MLFESRSEKAINTAVCRGGRRASDYHQPRAARYTRVTVVRILMSALLTKYHLVLSLIQCASRPCLEPALEAEFVFGGHPVVWPLSTGKTLCQTYVQAIQHPRTS